VASDVFVVPGPRIVDAASAFERMLVGQPILAAAAFQAASLLLQSCAEPPRKAAAARIGCPT